MDREPEANIDTEPCDTTWVDTADLDNQHRCWLQEDHGGSCECSCGCSLVVMP